MPTYEYLCKTCDLRFDAVQSFADDAYKTCDEAPITCPRSGGGELRKVFGAVGITFKGSGFYKNDSRGTTSTTTPSGSGDSGGAGASTSESTPASTPAPSGDSGSSSSSHSHSHGPGTHTH